MKMTNLVPMLALAVGAVLWPSMQATAQEPRNSKPSPGAERREDGRTDKNRPISRENLEYAQRVIKKYDLDKSGDLTSTEWVEMAKSPEAADANGDKRVTAEEFAHWEMSQARGPQPSGAPGVRGPGGLGPAGPGIGPGRGLEGGLRGPNSGFGGPGGMRPGPGGPMGPGGMPGMRPPGMGAQGPDWESMRENDPEMYKLEMADREMERQTAELSAQHRNAPKDRRETIHKELEDVISKHFEVRQQRRMLQLSRLEKELQRMRDEIERRNERRGEIVGKRITELVGDKGDLDF